MNALRLASDGSQALVRRFACGPLVTNLPPDFVGVIFTGDDATRGCLTTLFADSPTDDNPCSRCFLVPGNGVTLLFNFLGFRVSFFAFEGLSDTDDSFDLAPGVPRGGTGALLCSTATSGFGGGIGNYTALTQS